MKSIVLTALLSVLLWAPSAYGCDVCGCAVGNSHLGILPQFRGHFAGLRYHYRTFHSTHPPLFGEAPGDVSDEVYQSLELWGRWSATKQLQVFGSLPLHHFARVEQGSRSMARGPGDATLLLSWIVLDTGDSTSANWKHALQLGGGVKLPTGSSNIRNEQGSLLFRNMQPGTGSFDIPLNAMYTLRYKGLGFVSELNYRLNLPNRDGYRFGNQAGAAGRLFYWLQRKQLALLPSAGLLWEHAAPDEHRGIPKDFSAGHSSWAAAGLDVFLSGLAFSVLYQHPLSHHISEGYTQPHARISLSATCFF
jgi:hypothetical protein